MRSALSQSWCRSRFLLTAVMATTAAVPAAATPRSSASTAATVAALNSQIENRDDLRVDHRADDRAHQQARFLLNRIAFGPAPGDIERVAQIGSTAYLREQLHPERLAAPDELSARLAQFDSLKATPATLYASFGPPERKAAGDDAGAREQQQRNLRVVVEQTRAARLLKAIYSPAQLQEVMVDFWFNHFNVFIDKGQEGRLWTGLYERDAIRPFALGRFRDLLGATAKHPAMLYYLDNWKNSAVRLGRDGQPRGGLNENYARELMELHTLGVDGGYSQHDVVELARILTGWTFVPRDLRIGIDPAFEFVAAQHDTGTKQFIGETFVAGGGIEEGERALDLLARSPHTAQHLAYELAQYFVADAPPPALVARLSRRYLESDGDIAAVLETLFTSAQFNDPQHQGDKFKSPFDFVVSSVRASGLPMITNVRPLLNLLSNSGEPLYGCQTPDGYKNVRSAWLNPDAMLARLNFASALGSGRLPLWNAARDDAPADMPGNAAPLIPMAQALPTSDVSREPVWSEKSNRAELPRGRSPQLPVDVARLERTLELSFGTDSRAALEQSAVPLRAGLILGSPEFMWR